MRKYLLGIMAVILAMSLSALPALNRMRLKVRNLYIGLSITQQQDIQGYIWTMVCGATLQPALATLKLDWIAAGDTQSGI